jgi:misacylated tRNA(Ala) deacylase
MSKLGYAHPQVLEVTTCVAEVVAMPSSGSRIRINDDLFRFAAGGQPADKGWLAWNGGQVRVEDVARRDGQTWLFSGTCPMELEGQAVVASIDAKRRRQLSRCHSLTHILMGCLRRHVPGFECRGAEISEDGDRAMILFSACTVSAEMIDLGVADARAAIALGADVAIVKFKSISAAKARFPHLRIDPDLQLNGRVRVVDIVGVDTNPCSGSHVLDIAEIGEVEIEECCEDNGLFRLTAVLLGLRGSHAALGQIS